MPKKFSNSKSRTHYKLSSEVFDCMNTVDHLNELFNLIEMCQELMQSSDESDVRSNLLIESFFLQARPSVKNLQWKLRHILNQLT